MDNGAEEDGEKVILRGVTALFRPGRFTAIMGASGAGKTSLLRAILGLAPLDGAWMGALIGLAVLAVTYVANARLTREA